MILRLIRGFAPSETSSIILPFELLIQAPYLIITIILCQIRGIICKFLLLLKDLP